MKQFKAESKKVLDLMINSIYTNKEIFLRELISNASDAIDKLAFIGLTDSSVADDFEIRLTADNKNRTLTVSDNGVGMSKEDLEENLGVIAHSGTSDFKAQNKTDADLIGQFGVGFYSSFMVAKKVAVISKKHGEAQAYRWESVGAEGYDITPAQKEGCGTEIILWMKDNDDDYAYDGLLGEYKLRELVKKYSDYIRHPIRMEVSERRLKDGSDKEYETVKEVETLNSMIPIWKRGSGADEKQYNEFFKQKFYEFTEPTAYISAHIEGLVNYDALVFIPGEVRNYFTKEYERGLELYSSGVMIMERCPDLLPEYLGFMKGVVDSQDVSLNISREMLQKDRQLRSISKSLEKKVLSELSRMLTSEREKYESFFGKFGTSLKFGLYNNFGEKKEELKDLILFYSSKEKKFVSLKEYVSRMKDGQTHIYYACGRSPEAIDIMPKTEYMKDKGVEILYLSDHIDEFMVKILGEYDGKKLVSVAAKDAGEGDADETSVKSDGDSVKALTDFMTETLKGRVKETRLSHKMKNHAACLVADGEVSLEMERVLKALDEKGMVKAQRVLEINPAHSIYTRLKTLLESDKELLATYTLALYNQAVLLEGLPIEDTGELVSVLDSLLNK